ncbi:MAG: OprO/OprP family phosphate-selective porin [Pseudobdellovibrio sp.]|nr:OprO/OprP family phosphate-selective porin [Pseudobdellovibrio sp.]
MKQLVTLTFLGLAFALPASAKPEKNCALAYAAGDSCKNLRVDFDLKKCGVTTSKKPKISCGGSSATATVEAEKWIFKTKLKHYVGQNSSIWDVNGDVQFFEKSEPALRKVATESPAPVSVSATAVTSAPQAPVSAPAQVVETKSDFVPTGKNNALVQFWYVEDQTQYATAADKNFRVRRAELKLTGSSAENTRWFLVADFAKSLATTTTSVVTSAPSTKTNVTGINTDGDNKILQDMGIALKLVPDLELTLGQFKLPTTAESMQSTSELLFAERSLLTRTYGERRDPGAMLSYKYDKIKASVAMSNGQGPNVDEKNDRKDYTGRLEATLPWGFNVGTFALCKEAICYDLNRYGANLGWTYSDFNFRAEYVNSNISSVRATTYMVDAGYKLSDKWQVATRYESLQPNVSSSFKSSAATVGVNYFLSKQNLKFQLNHTQLFNMRGNNGSYSSSADQKGSLIIFAIQNNF